MGYCRPMAEPKPARRWRMAGSPSALARMPLYRPRSRGQAFIEAALVVVALCFLMIGVVEVGWAFMRTSMITHAARDGARYGATLANSTGLTYRDAGTGCFTPTGQSKIQ